MKGDAVQRGRVYYSVRTLVRWVFWSTILFLIVVGLGTVLEFFDKSDENQCDVAVHFDFTWDSRSGDYVNVDRCNHPRDVVLLQDGTWIWALTD